MRRTQAAAGPRRFLASDRPTQSQRAQYRAKRQPNRRANLQRFTKPPARRLCADAQNANHHVGYKKYRAGNLHDQYRQDNDPVFHICSRFLLGSTD